MNYARRQQYRRLSRAGRLALAGLTVALLGMLLLSIGFALPGGLLLAPAVTIGFRARYWLSLAGRSRVGAHSEEEVRRALAPLEQRGWRLRHGLHWQGRGDIDSVAIAPTGVGFAIDRDQDPDVRRAPARSGARAGKLAPSAPAEVVQPRCVPGPVRGSRGGSGALRAWCARGLNRPIGAGPVGSRERRGTPSRYAVTWTVGPVARRR